MSFPKKLIALAVTCSFVATPALAAGAQSLSVVGATAVSGAKDVRASTKSRKSSKVGGEALGLGIAAAAAAGLGIAAAAGAFKSSSN